MFDQFGWVRAHNFFSAAIPSHLYCNRFSSTSVFIMILPFLLVFIVTTASAGGVGQQDQAPSQQPPKKEWLTWVQVSCLTLAGMGIMAKLYAKCKNCWEGHCCLECQRPGDEEAGQPGWVICYLCNKKVPRSEWENQETGHRNYCAVKSKENRGGYYFYGPKRPKRQKRQKKAKKANFLLG